MEWIQIAMTIWLVAFMVFKVNPLNDPTNPTSMMCPLHPENIQGRAELEVNLKEERKVSCRETDVIILWPDVWPYLSTTIVSIFAWIIYKTVSAIVI